MNGTVLNWKTSPSFSCFKRWPDETLYISRRQQMQRVFKSGWYVKSVYLLIFFPCSDQDSDLPLKLRFLVYFSVLFHIVFRFMGLFYIFLFQFFFTPLKLSWDRKHRTTVVIVYIHIWPFFLLFRLLHMLGAANPFYRCSFCDKGRVWLEVKKGLEQRHICPLHV